MNEICSFTTCKHDEHDKHRVFCIKLKSLVKTSIDDEIMSHSNSFRSHRMLLCIYEFTDDGVIKVCHLFVRWIVFDIHFILFSITDK